VQPLLQWKIIKYYIFWECVCSVRYPACSAHEPYCQLCCLALQYFSTFSYKWHDSRNKVL